MPKTIALQHLSGRLAGLLAARGYKVVSLHEAARFRAHIDAVLYSGHSPDTPTAHSSAAEAADISLGHWPAAADALPAAVMLNIAGRTAEEAADELEYRLQHRHWRT